MPQLNLIKLNHFKNWIDRLPIKDDPFYYEHLIYFRQETMNLTDTIGQTKTAKLLNLSQAKLSHMLTLLRLLPNYTSLGRATLDSNTIVPFQSHFDYVDWTRSI